MGNSIAAIAAVLKGTLVSPRLQQARYYGKAPRLRFRGRSSIGERFACRSDLFPISIDVGALGDLLIGDDVFINQGTRIACSVGVSIGSRSEIGDLVAIYDTNFHQVSPDDEIVSKPVDIGEDCWIGSQAIILPGVTLGRGSVVAAGSVVTKSFEEGSLVGGNPARLLRKFNVPTDFRRRAAASVPSVSKLLRVGKKS